MSDERIGLVNLDEFFGVRKADRLRKDGSTGLIPLGDKKIEDYENYARRRGCDVTWSTLAKLDVAVLSIFARGVGPLEIFAKIEPNSELSQPYILDMDLVKFREVFGGQK